jgi:hypothetical protein
MEVKEQSVYVLTEPEGQVLFQSEDEFTTYLKDDLRSELDQWQRREWVDNYEKWFGRREIHRLDLDEWELAAYSGVKKEMLKHSLLRTFRDFAEDSEQ